LHQRDVLIQRKKSSGLHAGGFLLTAVTARCGDFFSGI
jgi:hypothetical protein